MRPTSRVAATVAALTLLTGDPGSTLAQELQVNPFLRTRELTVIEAARQHDPQATAGASTLAVIRALKDRF